ncbi:MULTISPECIES: SURF1 family protein [Brevundimonas]|uniref:SURF1 family protein n=1 Tax=Brevundimonas TaxID=41275 RepID=UPI000F03E1FA|nr:SURF1 family protein [Brevundimonas lutea]
MTTSERRRFPLGLTAACGLSLALLLGLGIWQVQRLGWKTALIAQAEARAAEPARPFAEVFHQRPVDFRKAVVDCPGLATAPYVELQSIQDGQAGVRLISLCQPPGFEFLYLVDRGFVADTISARPPVRPSNEITRVEVEMRIPPGNSPFTPAPSGNRFYGRDRLAMAEVLGAALPVDMPILFATTSSNPDWQALRPSAPPAAYSNNHLGYALTWFGLAIALFGFYIALLRRRLSRSGS